VVKESVLRSSLFVVALAALSFLGGCSGANIAPPAQPSNGQGATLPLTSAQHGNAAVTNTFPRHPYLLHPATPTLSLQFNTGDVEPNLGAKLYAAEFAITTVNEYALPNGLNHSQSARYPVHKSTASPSMPSTSCTCRTPTVISGRTPPVADPQVQCSSIRTANPLTLLSTVKKSTWPTLRPVKSTSSRTG
jgi:hypothetical protein